MLFADSTGAKILPTGYLTDILVNDGPKYPNGLRFDHWICGSIRIPRQNYFRVKYSSDLGTKSITFTLLGIYR
jgi:hypothetical protein